MRWSIGYFGVKDLFTLINLLGGVMGIHFAVTGRIDYAGYAIFAGFVFGDALDGLVARATHTANRFGGEFDAAVDHLSQAVAPAIIVYAGFSRGGHGTLGLALLALIITTASIRQARFQVAPFCYPLTYAGLPRTVSGLVAISLPNSTLFFEHSVLSYPAAAAVLALVAALNLSPVPYTTHKGRKLQGWVKPFVAAFLVGPFLLFFLARDFVYDFLFVITFGYALAAWIPLRPAERREYWTEYRRWSREVASRK